MPEQNLSEKRREKWFQRLEASRKAYFFQKWRKLRKKEQFSLNEWMKGCYGDLRYIVMWNVNLVLQLKRYGAGLKSKHGVSYWEQWYKMAYLVFLLRANPKRFRTHHLFKPEYWDKVREFTYGRHWHVHLNYLGYPYKDELEILNNKFKFFEFCTSHSLSTPEVIATFEGGEITYPDTKTFKIPDQTIFIKDLEGGQGSGVRKLIFQDEQYCDMHGNRYSKKQVYDSLVEYSKTISGTLVQTFVKNHEAWKRFTNGSLATCRIVTARSARNEDEIIPMFATFRMPFGDSDADNFSLGGIGASIDMNTGILGHAVSPDPIGDHLSIDKHPDTKAQITGEKLYFWEEIIEFAKNIHRHFQTISIGWDIACTEEGLCLIEGNITWGSNIIEVPSGVPLVHTIFPEIFEEWVEKR